MRAVLKLVAALTVAAVVGLGATHFFSPREAPVVCDTLTLPPLISAQTFIEARDCLVRSTAAKKIVLIRNGLGGDGLSAIAIGTLIHRHGWDVEVTDLCASSCANYIFPAGKTKYLDHDSLLVFHGGFHQASLLEWAQELDRSAATHGAPVTSLAFGEEGKEGVLRFNPEVSPAADEVRAFLSMENRGATYEEELGRLRAASDRFYRELDVNPLLPEFGQTGVHEPAYKSKKFGGFLYRLDSLHRLGVRDIELKNAEWRPERNPEFSNVYEVVFP